MHQRKAWVIGGGGVTCKKIVWGAERRTIGNKGEMEDWEEMCERQKKRELFLEQCDRKRTNDMREGRMKEVRRKENSRNWRITLKSEREERLMKAEDGSLFCQPRSPADWSTDLLRHTHTRYRQTLNLHWFDQGPVCIWVSLLFTSSVCNSRWSTMWIQCCPWVWSCHMMQPSISQTASVNLMLFYKSDKYKTWRELNSQTNHWYTLLGVTFPSMALLVQ